VLPVVAQVEGVGELLAGPEPAQPGLGAVQRSLGFLGVPPAGRDDQSAVGQGELVQVVVVPACERVIDRLAELLERRGADGDQYPARPGPPPPPRALREIQGRLLRVCN
jgi:hypothetical protein